MADQIPFPGDADDQESEEIESEETTEGEQQASPVFRGQLQWMQDVSFVLGVLGLNAATGAHLGMQAQETQTRFVEAVGRLCATVGIQVEMKRIVPATSIVDGYGRKAGAN